VADGVVVDPPAPAELHEDLVCPAVVHVADGEPLLGVEAIDLDMAQQTNGR
jgi:hypothetical protein